MSDLKNDFLKLRGLFVFDNNHYGSALTAFRENALINVSQGVGKPNNASALADWMAVSENTLNATGNKNFSACWIDDGTVFQAHDINAVSDTDSLDRIDLIEALRSADQHQRSF